MKRQVWLLWAMLASPVALGAARRSSSAIEMEERLERRVQQLVKDFLPAETRAAVAVRIQEAAVGRKPASAGPTDAPADWPLLGYLIPVPPIDGAEGESSEMSFEGVEIEIKLQAGMGGEIQKSLRQHVESALKAYAPKVRIAANLPVAPATSPSDRQPASDAEKKSAAEPWHEKLRPWAPALALSLLAGAIVVVAALLLRGLSLVAEGIRSVRGPAFTNSKEKPLHIAIQRPESDDAETVVTVAEERDRYLRVVETTLAESPLAVLRALGDTSDDRSGARFLLALLEGDSRTRLRSLLGRERISQLEAVPFRPGFDGYAWLRIFAQQIAVRLASAGLVERNLTAADAVTLSTAEPETLFQVALSSGDPAVLRVASEFLPQAFWISKTQTANLEFVLKLSKAAVIDEATLREGLQKLVAKIQAQKGGARRDEADESRRYVESRLVPVARAILESKRPGEDEAFLAELRRSAPAVARAVASLVWTVSKLDDIEDASLRDAWGRVPNDAKARVLWCLPLGPRERLLALLPQGMGSRIVVDTLARLEATPGGPSDDAYRTLREFLGFLKEQAESGRVRMRAQTREPSRGEAA